MELIKNTSISLAFIVFCVLPTILKAQNAVVTTGKIISSENGSVSYSIGQVGYSSINGSNGNLIEGVQQPYEISVITQSDYFKEIVLECEAYPNPTSDKLFVRADNSNFISMSYQLFTIDGQLVKEGAIKDFVTSVSMLELVSSSYYLTISADNVIVKTFKIIKN